VREPSGADTSAMFAQVNRSTRSLALDMKEPENVELFMRLAANCDIIIENFAPGVLDGWGLSYERLASVNPGIILLSVSGFGRSGGPRSHYRAYGATVASFVGLTQAWGHLSGNALDFTAEAHGLLAILLALAARDRTGIGTHVDLSMVETAACMMAPLMLDYLANGRDSQPRPNEVPGSLLCEVVPCGGSDQWLAVEAEDDADWRALATLLGRPELAARPPAPAARQEAAAALSAWSATLTPQQAVRLLQRGGIAAGVVQNCEDVVCDPQHRARDFFYEMDHPDLGVAEYASSPYRVDGALPHPSRPTPRLGEHNGEVLESWLAVRGVTAPGRIVSDARR
jgi:crotonobetainyl-CoA:carnitine CoA-transferase CaiB-like acyl-CoA transferase